MQRSAPLLFFPTISHCDSPGENHAIFCDETTAPANNATPSMDGSIHRNGSLVIKRINHGNGRGLSASEAGSPFRTGTQNFSQNSFVKKSLWRKPACHRVITRG